MFDDLLELFERDRKPGTQPKSGLRSRLSSLLGNDDCERPASPDRGRHVGGDRDNDDRRFSRTRSRDLFDFGD